MPKRRVKVDKWKLKRWYDIYAPDNLFQGVKIGETPATKKEHLLNRKVEVSLFELTGDYQHDPIKLVFKIVDVADGQAKTIFDKEYISNTYLKSLVRRRTTRVDVEVKARTKDGLLLHMFGVAFTERKIITSVKRALRRVIREELEKFIRESTLNDIFSKLYIKEPGDFMEQLFSKMNKIARMRKFEIRKTVVLERLKTDQAERMA